MNTPTYGHSQWDTLPALDQWLWILRTQIEKGQHDSGYVVPSGETGKPLIRLMERHLSNHGRRRPTGFENGRDPGVFLKIAYKTVFRSAPLEAWEALLSSVPRDVLPFTRREIRILSTLSRFWRSLISDDRRIRLEAAEDFVPFLAESLGWQIISKKSISNEMVYHVALGTISLPVNHVPVIISFVFGKPGSADKARLWVEELWQTVRSSAGDQQLAITIPVGSGTQYGQYVKWSRSVNWLACIDSDWLRDIFTAERYSSKLQELLRKNLGLAKLNPYKYDGPVIRHDMFLGREREIQKILAPPLKDFLVIGSRRIGKSSLLTYLRDSIAASDNREAVFIDCSNITSLDEFAKKVATRIAPRRAHRMNFGQFGQMVRAARTTTTEPFLLLLDEADELVRMADDSGDWRLFSQLRELSSQGASQAVLAGYKVLIASWKARKSPLFNFATPLYLSVLPDPSARQLVEQPLSHLSVEFESPKLIQRIVRDTGAHPSLLQFFCSTLIDILDENDTKTVTSRELKAVQETREYREFVLKPFGTEVDFTPLERWLVLALVRAKLREFSNKMVMRDLGSTRPWLRAGNLGAAFDGLELSGLIRQHLDQPEDTAPRSDLHYVWSIPAFAVAAEKTMDVGRLLTESERQLAP